MSSAQLLFEIGSFDISQPVSHCHPGPNLLLLRRNLLLVQPTQHPLCRDLRKPEEQTIPCIRVLCLCVPLLARLFSSSDSPAFPARPPILPPVLLDAATQDDERAHSRKEDGLFRLPLVQTVNAATVLLSPAPGLPRVPVLPPQPATAIATAQRSRPRHFHHPSHHPSPAQSPRDTPALVAGHRQLDIST